MKRPIIQVVVQDAAGVVVHSETRAAFNAGVRASEAAIRTIAHSDRTTYEADRPNRDGDVYKRRWQGRNGRVLFAVITKESDESLLQREFGTDYPKIREAIK